jgi:MFS family permease
MTDAQFGLLTAVFLWTYAVLSPVTGFLADRFNRSRVIIGSLLIWSALTWLTGHARTFDQLLIVRALMGVSEAAYIPAAMALIADYHRGPTRSLANAIHLTGINLGSVLGGLGGWMADRHGWSYAFHFFGLIGIGYSALLVFTLRAAPREAASGESIAPTRVREALASLFSTRAYYLMLLYWGLFAVGGWALMGWMPTYLKEQFNLSQGVAGLSATGYLQVASMIGLVIGGFWADRWARRQQRGRLFVALIGNGVAAPGILIAAGTDHLTIAIAGLILFGLARAWADANTMPILCLIADPRYRATGYGLMNFVACAVGGLTIYAGGVLRDAHIDVSRVFQFGALCFVLCSTLLFFVRPAATRQSAPPLAPLRKAVCGGSPKP